MKNAIDGGISRLDSIEGMISFSEYILFESP